MMIMIHLEEDQDQQMENQDMEDLEKSFFLCFYRKNIVI